MAKNSVWKKMVLTVLAALVAGGGLITPVAVSADSVAVSLAPAQATVAAGDAFTARVNLSAVANLDACNYDVVFDAAVLALEGVGPGAVGGAAVPVDTWNRRGDGIYTVVQNIAGLDGVSGAGYLAELRFRAIGAAGQSSGIALSNGILGDTTAAEIPAAWTGATVTVAGSGGGGGPVPTTTATATTMTTPTIIATPPAPVTTTAATITATTFATVPPMTVPATADAATHLDAAGAFAQDVVVASADGALSLDISQGCQARDMAGQPVAAFTMSRVAAPAAAPAEAYLVGTTYEMGPAGTTFAPPVQMTFAYDPAALPAGDYQLKLAWWDDAAARWRALEGGVVDAVRHTVSAPVSHFTAFAVLAYAETAPAAAITLGDLAIDPLQPQAGDTVTVSAIARNAGATEGSLKVSCRVNGEVIGEKIVTVPAGGSAPVSFTLQENAAGTYNVDLNGLAGSFTIEGSALLGWFRWLVVSVIVLSIVGIGVLGFVVLRRARRAGPGQPVK